MGRIKKLGQAVAEVYLVRSSLTGPPTPSPTSANIKIMLADVSPAPGLSDSIFCTLIGEIEGEVPCIHKNSVYETHQTMKALS